MRVYVDYDSTLNNLTEAWLQWIVEHYGVTITLEEINSYHYIGEKLGRQVNDFWKTPGNYSMYVDLYPGALEFFLTLQKIFGRDNVFILTSTPTKDVRGEKSELASMQLGITQDMVIHACDKWVHTKDSLIIDDYPAHILDHVKINRAPAVLFDRFGLYGWSKLKNYDDYDTTQHDEFIIQAEHYGQIIAEVGRFA